MFYRGVPYCKGKVKNNVIPKFWRAILKENNEKGKFKKLVRKTAFSKIFENIIYAPKMHHTCTIHVWCMYGACMVYVWCMYGACMVHFENWGLSRVFFVWCKSFAVLY